MMRWLYLEDNPLDAELVRALLIQEWPACELYRVDRREAFKTALSEGGLELILSDYSLPEFDGLSALRLASEQVPEVPFIFVSGTIGEDIAVEALKHGAADYVIKDRLARLVPAIRRALQDVAERAERRKLESQFLRVQRLESIGMLAGGIAHDLNNVLTPILMASQVLQNEAANEADRRMLETIESSALHGAALIRQILAFARGVEEARMELQPAHVITELARLLRDTLPRSIVLATHLADDGWNVQGDATQINQVLMNLCVNARDAMPQGGRLTLRLRNVTLDQAAAARLHPDASPGAYVEIAVEDTGTGIPSEVRARIFEPFFSTKPEGKGTGLGLSTALRIVKDHGGFMTVGPLPAGGTRFGVFLPALATPEELTSAEAPELWEVGGGEGVVVIDDEASIRTVMQAMLERFGYRVFQAPSGYAARECLRQHRGEIQVALVDMMMPELDGWQTMRLLYEENPHLRLIALSGLPEPIDPAPEALPCRYLTKPVYTTDLLRALR